MTWTGKCLLLLLLTMYHPCDHIALFSNFYLQNAFVAMNFIPFKKGNDLVLSDKIFEIIQIYGIVVIWNFAKVKTLTNCRKIIFNQLQHILISITIFIVNFSRCLASASSKNENYRWPVSTFGMLPKPTFYE